MPKTLLSVEDLSISFFQNKTEIPIIKSISYHINENEIVAIVGESGSGKSVSSMAINGLLPKHISKVTSGNIKFEGTDLTLCSEADLQQLRGNDIGMIFQEPMSALNPSMTCGKQVEEVLKQHTTLNAQERKSAILKLFQQVKLPHVERLYKVYPHEISGGQKQRVMIAMAIACQPKLLIADEPTTALDVTVQKDILELLKEIQHTTKMSILFISHDLALVSEFAHRVMVMYQGEIIEQGDTKTLFNSPQHAYTKALLNSRPKSTIRLKHLPTVADMQSEFLPEIITAKERAKKHDKLYSQDPLLELYNIEKVYFNKAGWLKSPKVFKAVNNVSFKVYPGETLGLVGESGCGKSTLGNAILQLDKASKGTIKFKGKDITQLKKKELRRLRKDLQIIFQDPFASLNPRLPIGEAIIEPILVHGLALDRNTGKQKVKLLLKDVGLKTSDYNKYPHEFSGGQRQRVGIARAIAVNPKLIVCDESVSALDISVQAQVLNLLNRLKDKFNFTYIFISHDLSVVKFMADQLVVMKDGKIEEMGEADSIYKDPKEPYTKKLIHAIPQGL